MARPRKLIPTYRKHSSGRAAVSIYRPDGSRTEVLLPGAFGSKESMLEYERLLAQLRANDGKAEARTASSDTTIAELVAQLHGRTRRAALSSARWKTQRRDPRLRLDGSPPDPSFRFDACPRVYPPCLACVP